jgi:putative NADH-flavin reductase
VNLFVLGATGATGREVVRQAIDAGHRLTAYGRRAGDLPVDDPALTIVTGDVTDVDALAVALPHHDAVISTLGVPRRPWTLRNNTLIATSTRALVAAADRAGVRRLVVLSAFGVGDSYPKASLFARFLYRTVVADIFRDKEEGESTLRSSDLDWTLAYPVTLNKKPGTGTYVVTPLEKTGHVPGLPVMPRADLARFLLRAAGDDEYVRQIVVLNHA